MRFVWPGSGGRVLIVLKYGGNAMTAGVMAGPDPLLDELAERLRGGDRLVLVHGGGPQIDAALRGRPERRVGGLRVTDAGTLAVVEQVLCGSVNKRLVRALLRRGVAAVGLSGQDGPVVLGRRLPTRDGVDLGFVGEVERVDPRALVALLDAGFTPVVAPLSLDAESGEALNVNADTTAGALAGALRADAYVIVTNVERVRRDVADPASGIAELTAAAARAALADGTFDGGMRPKMESALDALSRGAKTAVIAGSGPHAIARALAGAGTTIRP